MGTNQSYQKYRDEFSEIDNLTPKKIPEFRNYIIEASRNPELLEVILKNYDKEYKKYVYRDPISRVNDNNTKYCKWIELAYLYNVRKDLIKKFREHLNNPILDSRIIHIFIKEVQRAQDKYFLGGIGKNRLC